MVCWRSAAVVEEAEKQGRIGRLRTLDQAVRKPRGKIPGRLEKSGRGKTVRARRIQNGNRGFVGWSGVRQKGESRKDLECRPVRRKKKTRLKNASRRAREVSPQVSSSTFGKRPRRDGPRVPRALSDSTNRNQLTSPRTPQNDGQRTRKSRKTPPCHKVSRRYRARLLKGKKKDVSKPRAQGVAFDTCSRGADPLKMLTVRTSNEKKKPSTSLPVTGLKPGLERGNLLRVLRNESKVNVKAASISLTKEKRGNK